MPHVGASGVAVEQKRVALRGEAAASGKVAMREIQKFFRKIFINGLCNRLIFIIFAEFLERLDPQVDLEA